MRKNGDVLISGKTSIVWVKISLSLFLLSCVGIIISLASCNDANNKELATPSDLVSQSQQDNTPVDVSMSDSEMVIGVNTVHIIQAEGGETISWRSSDDTIATIDQSGNITGIAVGKCDITAENEFGRSAQCHVTVKKTVFLTIDDGPLSQCDNILKTLKKHDVKATFFVVNTFNFDAVKRIHKNGHLIGLHTFSHSYSKCYRSQYSYFAGLEMLRENVEKLTGESPDIIRFPGGSGNTVSDPLAMRRTVSGIDDLGYRAFDWTASAGDATSKPITSDTIAKNVKHNCYHDYEILLMHDTVTTPDALDIIIPSLTKRGYIFDTLDHCAEHSHLSPTWYEKSVSKKALPCQNVAFTVSTETLRQGESFTAKAQMTPKDTTDYLRFVSDDPSVASITLEGVITGNQPGKTAIRAIASSGAEAVFSLTVE